MIVLLRKSDSDQISVMKLGPLRQSLPLLFATQLLMACGDQFILPLTDQNVIIAPKNDPRAESEPGSYLVMFKSEEEQTAFGFQSFYNEYRFHYEPLWQQFSGDRGVKNIEYITAVDLAVPDRKGNNDFIAPRSLQLAWDESALEPLYGILTQVDFHSPEEAEQTLKKWESTGRIWYAEPNWISKLYGQFDDLATSYESSGLAHITRSKIAEAFKVLADKVTAGETDDTFLSDNSPTVAVVDSGTDTEHPALKDNIWINDYQGQVLCTNDANGCNTTKFTKGYLGTGEIQPFGTSGPGDPCPEEVAQDCKHGTHVAGIIAGKSEGGAYGVCPFCNIMTLQVISKNKEGKPGIQDSAIVRAFKYISNFQNQGRPLVRIVNSSFGKFQRSRSVALLVRQLGDTLVIGAAGNEDTNSRQYPAALDAALAVSALDTQDKKASFSNFGTWVDVAAPGVLISSAIPGSSSTGRLSGTSQASPIVAGIAALLFSMNPNFSVTEVKDRLMRTADGSIYNPDENEGFNFTHYYYPTASGNLPLLGTGIIDGEAALKDVPQATTSAQVARRVEGFCGSIEIQNNADFRLSVLVMLFLVPLVVGSLTYQKER